MGNDGKVGSSLALPYGEPALTQSPIVLICASLKKHYLPYKLVLILMIKNNQYVIPAVRKFCKYIELNLLAHGHANNHNNFQMQG